MLPKKCIFSVIEMCYLYYANMLVNIFPYFINIKKIVVKKRIFIKKEIVRKSIQISANNVSNYVT